MPSKLVTKVGGVYSPKPATLPRYSSHHGRDILDNLTVARIYLTGLSEGGISGSDLGLSTAGYKTLTGLFSLNGQASRAYVGFFLESVTERSEEKAQVTSLNGDRFAAYYLGAQPTQYAFRGKLLNTMHDDWSTIFSELYSSVFRGSVVAAQRRMVQVAYGDKIVTGAMSGFEQVIDSGNESVRQFSFSLLVYHVLHTSEPNQDRFSTTFLGDAANFELVDVQSSTEDPNSVVTAYVTPPPRPRKPRKSKKTLASCSPKHITNSRGVKTSTGKTEAQAENIKKCTAGIKTLKEAQRLYADKTTAQPLKRALLELNGTRGWAGSVASVKAAKDKESTK
jgi:hypothetical protein